ncbi:PREDICTED: prolactin-like [Chinchilla lanigera]|uniref:prolactin-like n=1 Tax=Chinchilla lanigera TaxID=34839 RepID=UPI00038EE72A|nr:PREDICTED: prolactin-like [Chinchilla lanigera]
MVSTNLAAQDKDLIILMIRLMRSWDDPLSQLTTAAARLPKVPSSFLRNAEVIQEKMQLLLEGLKSIAIQENLYMQDPNFYLMPIKSCHTASISTPQRKDEALRMHDKDLIILMIRLMRSWDDPLSHLRTAAARLPKVPPSFMQYTEVIQEKMQQLLEGLKTIALQIDPQIWNYGEPVLWKELPSLQSTNGDVFMDTFYNLCRCLRRDTNKVDTFLKILKKREDYADTS